MKGWEKETLWELFSLGTCQLFRIWTLSPCKNIYAHKNFSSPFGWWMELTRLATVTAFFHTLPTMIRSRLIKQGQIIPFTAWQFYWYFFVRLHCWPDLMPTTSVDHSDLWMSANMFMTAVSTSNFKNLFAFLIDSHGRGIWKLRGSSALHLATHHSQFRSYFRSAVP